MIGSKGFSVAVGGLCAWFLVAHGGADEMVMTAPKLLER